MNLLYKSQEFLFLDNLDKIYDVHLAGPQCGGQYTSSEGVVTSPGFPSPYTHESECVWTITVPAGDTITLTFTTIDIEFESTCDYDFVEVIKRFLILLIAAQIVSDEICKMENFHKGHLGIKFVIFYNFILIFINPSFIVIILKVLLKFRLFDNTDIQIQTQGNIT